MDRRAAGPGSGEPRWRRYGIHWHLFVRPHDLSAKARSAGSVAERYRSDSPDQVGRTPPEVLGWLRERIREALRDATGGWADPRRQGLEDLDGVDGRWARRLRGQLDKGLSSFQTVRVSDTGVVDVTAYAISGRDCDRHGTPGTG